jgi:hypothetical protein
MNQPSYIPPKDADFDVWLQNFSTLLTATPTAYGLIAGDAVVVAAQYTAWHAAYLAATNPTTRTSATVAAKDGARVTAVATIRPYAQQISKNMSVTDALKIGIGVNLPNNVPVPIPPVATSPALILQSAAPQQHILQYRDSTTPLSKAKPFGAIAVEIWRAVGVTAAVDPSACALYARWTKTPNISSFAVGEVGKTATYFARWVTRSGVGGQSAPGPWSAPLVAIVM